MALTIVSVATFYSQSVNPHVCFASFHLGFAGFNLETGRHQDIITELSWIEWNF